jgi:hypothetical protein
MPSVERRVRRIALGAVCYVGFVRVGLLSRAPPGVRDLGLGLGLGLASSRASGGVPTRHRLVGRVPRYVCERSPTCARMVADLAHGALFQAHLMTTA